MQIIYRVWKEFSMARLDPRSPGNEKLWSKCSSTVLACPLSCWFSTSNLWQQFEVFWCLECLSNFKLIQKSLLLFLVSYFCLFHLYSRSILISKFSVYIFSKSFCQFDKTLQLKLVFHRSCSLLSKNTFYSTQIFAQISNVWKHLNDLGGLQNRSDRNYKTFGHL